MANGTAYNWRTIAIGVVAAIVVLVVIAWLVGAFQGTPEQPITQAPQTDTTTAEPENTEPDAEVPAQ
jgi:cytochrome c-type biogenesis protein CcmH/NrfG